MKYIGNDIGKKACVVCIMNENGSILANVSYDNTFDDADNFAKDTVQRYGQCIAVCESTGNLWLKTYEAFERNGIEVKLANPVKT